MSNPQDNIENDNFLLLSRKALTTLDNLLANNKIDIPVQSQVLLDIGIGAVAEAQMTGKILAIDIFNDHPEFLADDLSFEQGGEYTLHDVMSQVVCFRLINMMEEYLIHLNIEYVSNFNEEPELDE